LHGQAKRLAEEQGIVEIQLSLSYTHTVGVASVVAIKEQDRPQRDNNADPRVELARQFKEMRAILDDMDERMKALDGEGALDNERRTSGKDTLNDEGHAAGEDAPYYQEGFDGQD
jgi:hypothetical protein